MTDIVYVVLILAGFVTAWAYARAAARL